MASSVSYRLVAPFTRFQFSTPDGLVVAIVDTGYATDDPRVQAELDAHPEQVERGKAKAGA
jgi:hypothetical protein